MSLNKISFDERIKPKNILALNEKVAAIRRYEMEPVYKKVGRLFNCSPDQIKRIIKQKKEILDEWNNRTKKSAAPTSHALKTVRMSFLGKAVHEWIRRMMYYSDFNLTNSLIETMALEFKNVLGLTHFYPTKDWVTNFRNTYGLHEVNTKTLNIGYQESHSVQIRDILRYLQEACGTKDVTLNDESREININQNMQISNEVECEIKVENSCNDVIEVKPEPCAPSCSSSVKVAPETKSVLILPPETPTIVIKHEPDPEEHPEPAKEVIDNHETAITCVKMLEEFALLKENFRMIGLIERLEEALNEKEH